MEAKGFLKDFGKSVTTKLTLFLAKPILFGNDLIQFKYDGVHLKNIEILDV